MRLLYKCVSNLSRYSVHRLYHDSVKACSTTQVPTFVTTPIFYVNADPHIGHLYSAVYADAIARFSRLVNPEKEIIFSTGTDEHGLKIKRSADNLKQDPQKYCDKISNNFRNLFDSANISYTVYNRTTDAKHKRAVSKLWNILKDNGYIYKSTYEGYYSVSDECFVPQNMIIEKDGKKYASDTGSLLEWNSEENYMFRLSEMQEKLVDWINNRLIIRPENFHAVLKGDIRNAKTLHDISISRTKSRLNWGVEVPNDPSQVIYVWFDALINYLTAAGYPETIVNWPPAHLIGKDILKFHAIYWPAFLLAAGIQPPDSIYCHSHWLYDNEKMSKSKGNVVNPRECIKKFTVDGMRFFLLKEGTPHCDSNFSMDKVRLCLNASLANTFGNILRRCSAVKQNPIQHYPFFDSLDSITELLPDYPIEDFVQQVNSLRNECFNHYLNGSFYMGISSIFQVLYNLNQMIDTLKPWKFVKYTDQFTKLDASLFVIMETLRVCAILLSPIIPYSSKIVQSKLNISDDCFTWNSAQFTFKTEEPKSLNPENIMIFNRLKF